MKQTLTLLMLIAATAAVAQERFEQTERRNPWNASVNAAGIRQDSLTHSYAEAYFTKENGVFAFSARNNHQLLRAVRDHIGGERIVRSASFFGVIRAGLMGIWRRVTRRG